MTQSIEVAVRDEPSLDSGLPYVIRGMFYLNCPVPLKSVTKAKRCFVEALKVRREGGREGEKEGLSPICRSFQFTPPLPPSLPPSLQVNPRSGRNLYFCGLASFLEKEYNEAYTYYLAAQALLPVRAPSLPPSLPPSLLSYLCVCLCSGRK